MRLYLSFVGYEACSSFIHFFSKPSADAGFIGGSLFFKLIKIHHIHHKF